ncbi:MFS transporter, PHS family, inorganic phosphate transporter [Picrophilus oshimae DSM 9789]|uniref:MFS transporter, PHS family, inorganic phosphate transporter n=2 Tax=Picrophilus oshimae TaxID=46632 RepID=A0A8G2FXF0_PICTO|nr:MFS transporter, PHS family, inorganic phosphate transporter [Picrophilus oshimae DSM 9789]
MPVFIMYEFKSLDNGRFGKVQRRMFYLSSLGLFLDGYDLSIITMAMLVIPSQLHLGFYEKIYVDTSSFIGMLIGAPVLGRLSDMIGRKRIFGLDLLFFVVFAITAGLSGNFYELFISRLLMGFGIGGDYPISSTMMSEFSPKNSRGRLLLGMVGMYWLGAFISAVMNYIFVIFTDFWRYTFIIGGIIALPLILLRLKVPESPRWLASKGKIGDAESVLKDISGVSDVEKSSKTVKRVHGFYFTLIFVVAAWFIFDVAAYGLGFYYPLIFSELGFRDNFRSIAEISMIISIGGMLGYVIALPVADKIGRRFLTIFGFFVMTLLLSLGSIIKISGIASVPFYFLFVLFEQWVGAVTLFYPTELFATDVRSTVQGIATAASRAGAILGIVIFPFYPVFHSLLVFAVASFIGLIIAIFMAPETNRKSLEQNVEMYTNKNPKL